MGTIVEIENLSYAYKKGKDALTDINIEIQEGEFLVIMGANGAGKTTLCLTLNGIIPSTTGGEFRGYVKVRGLDTLDHRVYELANHVGMVQQNPEAQLFMSNLEQELAFGPENLCVESAEIRRRITQALKDVRLEGLEKRSSADLSGGQKQRAAIATALTMQSDILVLDEPTSQLDPVGTEEVFSVVKDLNKKLGKTIVMAEHKSEEIAEFADRILLLDNGKMVALGTPAEVFSQVDLLHKVNVKPPQVTELAHFLKSRGRYEGDYPITLDDAVQKFGDLLKTNRISVDSKWVEARDAAGVKGKILLDVENLRHVYPPDIEALKGLDLKVAKGDFVAIIGQNGAGKTTLVKHFLNLLQPTEGSVQYSGYDCSILTVADLARHIGLVLQNPDHQLFESSVFREVIYGPRNLLKASKEQLIERVEKAMATLNIQHMAEEHPLALSWGDRQKVAVAAVLAMEPRIVIFDEPTTGMDYLGRHDIMQLARSLNQRGHTILTISHDMELLAEYSNWVVVMGQGKILYQGPTYKAFSQLDVLSETFLKPPQITLLGDKLKDLGFPQGILTVSDFCSAVGCPMPEDYGRENLVRFNKKEVTE